MLWDFAFRLLLHQMGQCVVHASELMYEVSVDTPITLGGRGHLIFTAERRNDAP